MSGVPKANKKLDIRRKRRALTKAELILLLDFAGRRPLEYALKVHTGKRAGQLVAKVRPEVQAKLQLLGRERQLLYKTLVLTGLRKGELASLTVAQFNLDSPLPFAELEAGDDNSREENAIPIRADLTGELKAWIADPGLLPSDLLFAVPHAAAKVIRHWLRQWA